MNNATAEQINALTAMLNVVQYEIKDFHHRLNTTTSRAYVRYCDGELNRLIAIRSELTDGLINLNAALVSVQVYNAGWQTVLECVLDKALTVVADLRAVHGAAHVRLIA